MDLERLGVGCQQRGILLCVDAIQQLGAYPLDVQASHCAFAMADGHKWMLGPEGLGVFYCRRDLCEQLKLHEYGWHMVEQVGDYDCPTWQPAHTACRFECGSPNLLGAVALEASLSLLEEVSLPRVAESIQARIALLQQGLSSIAGMHLLSPTTPERQAGIITFQLSGVDNARLFEYLKAQQVVCAQRGGGIRLSPHFYTPHSVLEETLNLLHQPIV